MSAAVLRAHIEARLITPRPDCKLWANACDRGYGRISIDGMSKRVHRVMWELDHGPISDGLTIDHLCRVRNCVNTEHMELVTLAENAKRATPFRPQTPGPWVRPPSTACKYGHEYVDGSFRLDASGRRLCLVCKPVDRCDKGHEKTPENTGWEGRCKRCRAEYMREWTRRKLAA